MTKPRPAVLYLCDRAVEIYGPAPVGDAQAGLFTSASFSRAVEEMTGLVGPLDGHLVQLILGDRREIERVDSCYWRLLPPYWLKPAKPKTPKPAKPKAATAKPRRAKLTLTDGTVMWVTEGAPLKQGDSIDDLIRFWANAAP